MKFQLNRTALYIAQAMAILSVAACGGGGESADADAGSMDAALAARDRTAPTVQITGSIPAASAGMLGLTGLAQDNRALSRVTWSNDRGGSGTAQLSATVGAATWTIASIALQSGDNLITVTAVDRSGNSAWATQVLTPSATPAPAPAPAPGAVDSYSTNFDLTENPISEGGRWTRADNIWTSVKTANGVAFGTNGITNSYDDSYALLTGSFGADQAIEAVVYRDQSLSPGDAHEVELLLRFSDDSGNARGYECLFNHSGSVQIMRWNGPFGSVASLSTTGPSYLGRPLVTGDVIKAAIVGNVITTYANGILMAQATDSTFTNGQPGMSFFVRPSGSPLLLGLRFTTLRREP